MAQTKRCILLNPRAGRGAAYRQMRTLVREFDRAGLSFDLVMTTEHGSGISLASQLMTHGYNQLVVFGGDGTLHEVVNGIIRTDVRTHKDVTLGIIPMGTGNDFIKSLDDFVAGDIAGSVQRLKEGRIQTIDVGHVTITTASGQTNRVFLNDLGMGIYALVAAESLKITSVKGRLVYALAVLRALAAYRPVAAQFRAGTHNRHQHFLLACVGNGRYQGAGFCLTPNALLDDALLDMCIIDAVPLHTLVRHMPAALRGTHTRQPQVTMGRERHIVVDYDVPSLISADGEILATDARSIDITVLPDMLNLIV